MTTQYLKLSAIKADPNLQMREQVSREAVNDYVKAMSLNNKFPALTIIKVGDEHYLVDGFHRYEAASAVKGMDEEVECEVTEGTMEDAIIAAAGANQANGLRRTNADKRKAVVAILRIERFKQAPAKKVAEICGVSDHFVGNLKDELSSNGSTMSENIVTERNGKPLVMKAKQQRKRKKPVTKEMEAQIHRGGQQTAPSTVSTVAPHPIEVVSMGTEFDETVRSITSIFDSTMYDTCGLNAQACGRRITILVTLKCRLEEIIESLELKKRQHEQKDDVG